MNGQLTMALGDFMIAAAFIIRGQQIWAGAWFLLGVIVAKLN